MEVLVEGALMVVALVEALVVVEEVVENKFDEEDLYNRWICERQAFWCSNKYSRNNN